MWKIKHIFDGDYGCEALSPGEKPKVSVTLVNENGEEKIKSVEDDWLTENGLDVGSEWPDNRCLSDGGSMMQTWYYEVISIEGDYANLKRTDIESDDIKLVARALLPAEIYEGCKLKYEMMQYSIEE